MTKILKYILFYSRLFILYKLLFLDNLNREVINEIYKYFRIMSVEYTSWVLLGETKDEKFLDITQIITSIVIICILIKN